MLGCLLYSYVKQLGDLILLFVKICREPPSTLKNFSIMFLSTRRVRAAFALGSLIRLFLLGIL